MLTFTFFICYLLQVCTTLLLDLISQLQRYPSSSPYVVVQAVFLVCNPPATSSLSFCYSSGPVSSCKQFNCPKKKYPPFPLLISPNHVPQFLRSFVPTLACCEISSSSPSIWVRQPSPPIPIGTDEVH